MGAYSCCDSRSSLFVTRMFSVFYHFNLLGIFGRGTCTLTFKLFEFE